MAIVIDVCIAGEPAINGVCGDPECVCAPVVYCEECGATRKEIERAGVVDGICCEDSRFDVCPDCFDSPGMGHPCETCANSGRVLKFQTSDGYTLTFVPLSGGHSFWTDGEQEWADKDGVPVDQDGEPLEGGML